VLRMGMKMRVVQMRIHGTILSFEDINISEG
jgi:hypothetical protein